MPTELDTHAPDPNGLPLFPASWYLFGPSRLIERRPSVRQMYGRDIVVFRTASGRAVAMDARCSHFAANLGNGRVVGETLQCPYHGWRYGPDGACAEIPSGCPIPEFARQKTFPVEERHGYLFLFNGDTAAFPLPWFDDVAPVEVKASRSFALNAECFWPCVTGHAFDLQHFLFVHDRRLLEPPLIDSPAPHVRRNRYRAEIVARNWRDRTLTFAGGRTVSASLTIFGGTFALISARFKRFESRFMMIMRPISHRETLCEGIAYGRPSWPLALEVRRFFTQAYLVEENRSLGRTTPVAERFVESDGPLADYFQFLGETREAGETV
jgi:phenylpropionate dioxygenase-like ring-hydroxylating dioxygenase large terminal subunit